MGAGVVVEAALECDFFFLLDFDFFVVLGAVVSADFAGVAAVGAVAGVAGVAVAAGAGVCA